jgi:hypothetical protein
MGVDSPTSGDLISSTGPVTLGGELEVLVDFTPAGAFDVPLLTGSSVTGAFDDVSVMNLPFGWQASVTTVGNESVLQVDPPSNARSLTLNSSATTRTFGQGFTLSGKATSAASACVSGVPVKITRDVLGGAVSFANVATVNTDADGDFTLPRTADRSATYKATIVGTVECATATSAARTVQVKKKVTLKAPGKVAKGARATLKASVAPCSGHQRKSVTLQRKTRSGFKKVATKATNAKCVATFRVVMRRTTVFRVLAPKTDADHLAGVSALKKVRAV